MLIKQNRKLKVGKLYVPGKLYSDNGFSCETCMVTRAEKCPALYVSSSGEEWHSEAEHSNGR